MRVSPNELIFCGANAWDDIYGNKVGSLPPPRTPRNARLRQLYF